MLSGSLAYAPILQKMLFLQIRKIVLIIERLKINWSQFSLNSDAFNKSFGVKVWVFMLETFLTIKFSEN